MVALTFLFAGLSAVLTPVVFPVPSAAQQDGWAAAIEAGDEALEARDYRTARRQYRRAQRIAVAFDADDGRGAQTLTRLARAYRAQGDFAKPEQLYDRVLEIAAQAHGPRSAEYARYLNEIGRYFHSRRKYSRAEELYRKSFSIRLELLGKEHPDVAEGIGNLAILYENQARYAKAEVYYRHCLEIREKQLGPEHIETITTLEHLARLLHKMNRAAEARPMQQRATAVRARRVAAALKRTVSGEIHRRAPGIRPPTLSERTEPEYTEEARIARHEGTVVLQGVIMPDGRIGNVRLVRSLGLGLDEKAVEALTRWRFEPARRGKTDLNFQASLEINFRIL
jgi:TonB family protein